MSTIKDLRLFLAIAVSFLATAVSAFAATLAEDHFETKVRPVLVRSCYGCHGAAQTSGLRLDSRDGLLKGGTRGPAIVPGKPEESLLVKALHYPERGLRMPPPGQLSPDEVAAIEQWIRDGAPWPDAPPATGAGRQITEGERAFWSYRPPKKSPPPAVSNAAWVRNDIDRFILAKLEEKRLSPVADADKRTLIRRVTFDLTGLPPTPEEVQGFLDDKSPASYERLVERLLATRAYAERWARMWLDVVRYADTSGSGADYPIPEAHKYRDWVIQAFDEDKPYNEFVKEQIAGDLLPSASEADHWNKTVATGYLAIARRGEGMNGTISDVVDNIGYAYLGMSVACARCHDHKFDPIPTRDYYALSGIFQSTRFPEPASEPIRYERFFVYRDPKALKSQEYLDFEAQLKPIAESIAAVNKLPYFDDVLPLLQARRMELFKKEPKFERAYAVAEGKPENAHVLPYGDPKNPAEEVDRGFLQILGGAKVPESEKGSGRLELAEWLSSADNPLAARVLVNRLWLGHFGKGLVPTPNDFGSRGVAPVDQPLLDYLAARFVEDGWSVKQLQKEILLSHTYQLSTTRSAADDAIDADNQLLWRQNRRRMDAEQLRDTLLDIGGTLDLSPAGPQPFPPPYEWNYSGHVPFDAVYETNRRSIYLMTQRIRQHPYLGLFDAPDPNASTPQRSSNATSLQALYFMNGELPERSANKLAAILMKEYASPAAQVDRAFNVVFQRPPRQQEKDRVMGFLTKATQTYEAGGATRADAEREAFAAFVKTLLATNEFLFLD